MNISLTDEQLKGILAESKEQLITAILEDVKNGISWEIKHAFSEEIRKVVSEYVATEITPNVKEYFAGNEFKQAILKATVERSTEVAEAVVQALSKTMLNNLGSSYNAGKIFELLIK